MLRIGDFAAITGISVKALRYYDEKSIIEPMAVDAHTGYRFYGGQQVRQGVMVRALRGAGVPLENIAAVDCPDAAQDTLSAHRQHILEQRRQEDEAFQRAQLELEALAIPVHVLERTVEAQPFVGRNLAHNLEEAQKLAHDAVSDSLEEVFCQFQDRKIPLTGTFWTALSSDQRESLNLLACWGTAEIIDPSVCKKDEVSGVLPRRRELVATWRPAGEGELPEDATHPAVVAIFGQAEQYGIDLTTCGLQVRQAVLGQTPEDFEVEVALTIQVQGSA